MPKVTFNTTKIFQDKNLIDPLIRIRTDICPICRAQRLELISFNGYPQNYSKAVDMYLQGYKITYDQYEIRAMKCQSCHREFMIDWNWEIPRPMIDQYRFNAFFQEYINQEQ